MDNTMKKTYLWWMIFLLAECLIVYLFQYRFDQKLVYLGVIGGIYLFANIVWLKPKRKSLFINGIIFLISITMIGMLVATYLSFLMIVSMGVAVSIVDVLSFTRFGQKTANAKAMSNPDLVYKLLIYGKGKGDTLYPTYGLGDCFYYALWMSGLSNSIQEMLLLELAILLGSVVNMLIVQITYKRPGYKGLPGIPIPYICVLIVFLLQRI